MYRGFILPEHRLALRKLIASQPILSTLFSQSWVTANLVPSPDQRIGVTSPFYSYLIHPKEGALTLEGLHLSAADQRLGIVGQLKAEMDEDNVRALVRNLQTFAVLRSLIPETVLEPHMPKGSKHPDIATLCAGKTCYLEVFSVGASAYEREEGRVIDELHARVNLLGDNPFVIQVDIARPPRWAEVEWLWACMKRAIYQNRGKDQIPEITIVDRQGSPVLILKLSDPNKRDKGFWGTVATGVRSRHDDARIKGKIIDKVGIPQFPSRDSINGYVLYLDDWMMDVRDVRNAILGQEMIIFREGNAEKAEYGRKSNGVLHHEIGREPLLKWVDFFVVAKHPADLGAPDELQIIRNDYRKRVTEAEIRNMLRAQESAASTLLGNR